MKLFNWFKKSYPLIGKEISWNESLLKVFKVIDFDRAGTKITPEGKVIEKSFFKPYGYLIVECAFGYVRYMKLPIIHRDDFLLAASVFDDITEEQELLVTYYPEQFDSAGYSLRPTHVLHYVLTPNGTMERFYDGISPTSKLGMESIFGYFNWTGEISVKLNLNPALIEDE